MTESCNRDLTRGEGLRSPPVPLLAPRPPFLPAPHPASSSCCTSCVAFPSSKLRRSCQLALEARSALPTTASTCAAASSCLRGHGHPEGRCQDGAPGEGAAILHPQPSRQPALPVRAGIRLAGVAYLSASARTSCARRLQFVGCWGISWGISWKCNQLQ